MNKKEKRMLKVRDKVRDLYTNSGIGMEEILEVIIDDACYYAQHKGISEFADGNVEEFWLHIERDLKKWREKNNGKSLKIYIAGYEKGISEDKAFISEIVMS